MSQIDDRKGLDAWDVYVAKAEQTDKDAIEDWEKGIDTLLVFAAIFSTIVAAFTLQSFSLTQANRGDITNTLLRQIAHSLDNSTSSGVSTASSSPMTRTMWINGLWFTSLICSLSTAFFAILSRQWIHQYKQWMSYAQCDTRARARLRHFRRSGIESWRVSIIIWMLPFILHVALVLFFVGLVLFASLSNIHLAILSGSLVTLILLLYIISIALPFFFVQCPFQILPMKPIQDLLIRPYRWFLQFIISLIRQSPELDGMARKIRKSISLCTAQSIYGKENLAITESQDEVDIEILISLMTTVWGTTSDKLIAKALSILHPGAKGQEMLRTVDAASLIEQRYLDLSRLNGEPPHIMVVPGSEDDAYVFLKALLRLYENNSVPDGWYPTDQLQHSLRLCKETGDENMKYIALELLDRFDIGRRDSVAHS